MSAVSWATWDVTPMRRFKATKAWVSYPLSAPTVFWWAPGRLLNLLQVVAPYKYSRASSQARINPGSASTPIVPGASNGVHVPA